WRRRWPRSSRRPPPTQRSDRKAPFLLRPRLDKIAEAKIDFPTFEASLDSGADGGSEGIRAHNRRLPRRRARLPSGPDALLANIARADLPRQSQHAGSIQRELFLSRGVCAGSGG